MNAIIYIHGKGGNAEEADHYRPLFPSDDVVGIDYTGSAPWDAGAEIHQAVSALRPGYDRLTLIANSIGAFFSMHAGIGSLIDHAYFIPPVVDMEKLIAGMMRQANVTEKELRSRGTVSTERGETLSWEYLKYVREHPVCWNVPTDILYGSLDSLTSIGTMKEFAEAHRASLTVMDGGEHWFHTPEQMRFLDEWIRKSEHPSAG